MNSSNSNVLSTFASNENKGLLWSVLHSGGKFNGIPETELKMVQVMFETTVTEVSETFQKMNQPVDLNIMNKEAVYMICKKLTSFVEENKKSTAFPMVPLVTDKKKQQIPQLETIYRAEDIQKERQNAFNVELKKKEEEMSSIMKLKKPDEIKFSDDNYDKPIGDDMERLLAETLASRERELELLVKNKEDKDNAEKWINSSISPITNKPTNNGNSDTKKKVSFNETRIEYENKNEYDTVDEPYLRSNMSAPGAAAAVSASASATPVSNASFELNTLMNKFKKINVTNVHVPSSSNNQSNQSNQSEHDNEINDVNVNSSKLNNETVKQISEDIAFIRKNVGELLHIIMEIKTEMKERREKKEKEANQIENISQ
jgi:hypothetical protein